MCGTLSQHGRSDQTSLYCENKPLLSSVSFFRHEHTSYLQIKSPDLTVTIFVTSHPEHTLFDETPGCWYVRTEEILGKYAKNVMSFVYSHSSQAKKGAERTKQAVTSAILREVMETD
jgi:hypothetical protein